MLTQAFRKWAARLTAAPTNLHQAVVFWLTSEDEQDARMRRWAPLLFVLSLVLVFAQTATAVGVLFGVYSPSCATSDHCRDGMFCNQNFDDSNGDGVIQPNDLGAKRCAFCGTNNGDLHGAETFFWRRVILNPEYLPRQARDNIGKVEKYPFPQAQSGRWR